MKLLVTFCFLFSRFCNSLQDCQAFCMLRRIPRSLSWNHHILHNFSLSLILIQRFLLLRAFIFTFMIFIFNTNYQTFCYTPSFFLVFSIHRFMNAIDSRIMRKKMNKRYIALQTNNKLKIKSLHLSWKIVNNNYVNTDEKCWVLGLVYTTRQSRQHFDDRIHLVWSHLKKIEPSVSLNQ